MKLTGSVKEAILCLGIFFLAFINRRLEKYPKSDTTLSSGG